MKPIDFKKGNGLVPVIIQDKQTAHVLMLGYMNEQAYALSCEQMKVTFFSRSKNRLWTKGETSKNYLWIQSIDYDCDQDALLIQVKADGPCCHTGTTSCFSTTAPLPFIYDLEKIIQQRIDDDCPISYTNQLYKRGINKIAQKVGEEAVELVIEAKDDDDTLFKNEAADLMYHYLLLLKAKNFTLADIEAVLRERNH